MKFLALFTIVPAIMAVAIPEPAPVAEPNLNSHLQRRTTCTRKLALWPDKHGVCVDTSLPSPQCTGGELYKADCGKVGKTWYCCII